MTVPSPLAGEAVGVASGVDVGTGVMAPDSLAGEAVGVGSGVDVGVGVAIRGSSTGASVACTHAAIAAAARISAMCKPMWEFLISPIAGPRLAYARRTRPYSAHSASGMLTVPTTTIPARAPSKSPASQPLLTSERMPSSR